MTRGAAVGVEALGPPPPAGANDSSSDVLRTVKWSDERGETRTAAVRRIPGWSWGVQLGVPWADGTAELVHATIEEHGLVVLAPPADFPKRPAAAGHAPEDAFDALRQLLEDLVSRERAAFQAEGVEWDSTDAETPVRSILARCHETLAQHHFELCCAVLRRCAMTVRGALHTRVDAEAAAALARVVAAIVETRAHRLQFGNTRYCIAKHFGYVLPTRALVRWLCDQFAGCERVVSVGAGSCFLEAAMQLEMRARGRATVLVCVENDEEMIGARRRDAGGAGFCVAPMVAEPTLEPFAPRDGLFICWGREDERGEGNIWTQAASMAVHSPDVDVAVIIGGADEQWYRCDRFAGHTLGPDSETQQRSGEAGWAGQDSASEDARVENYYGIEDRAVVWRRRPA